MADFYVGRPEMARQIGAMLSANPLSGALSGLFLAGPRRMGKSSFLRRDLIPHLKTQGRTVLYVDLWADRSVEPAVLLGNCVKAALAEAAGAITKLRRAAPVEEIGFLGFSLSLKSPEGFDGTLAEGLALLSAATGNDVVMIVDEAQQAIETAAGMDAMFSLKAARDAVNQSGSGRHLYLLMTGSHRDKLAALVYDQKSPFFGAAIREFPALGGEFTAAVTAMANQNLAAHLQLSEEDIAQGFEILGKKPEMLLDCLQALVLAQGPGPEALREIVQRKKSEIAAARRAEIAGLTTLQRAVLVMVAAHDRGFSPFTGAALDWLAPRNGGKRPSVGGVQKALDTLRDKGFVWRPGYGSYALENAEIRGALADLGLPE